MQIKKPLLIAGAVATIGVASAVVSTNVLAAPTTDSNSLVDKIAQRFNLNHDDVQKVFDEDHASHEAQHQAKLEDRLTQAVKDGKLTEDQKSKILAKLEELKAARQSEMDSLKDKTPEEMHTLMQQKRTDLEQWAKDNGIPEEYLHFVGPGLRMHVRKDGPGAPGEGHGEFHVHVQDDGPGLDSSEN